MTQRTPSQIGLVKFSDSEFVLANPEDDLCGKGVLDPEGQRLGKVEDLYIDGQEREVRFLEVGAGGVLGIGEKHFLVPVEAVTEVAEGWVTIEPGRKEKKAGSVPFDEAVTEVAEGWVTIEPGRKEKKAGSVPFDTRVAPPPADDRRSDDYTSLPFGRRPY